MISSFATYLGHELSTCKLTLHFTRRRKWTIIYTDENYNIDCFQHKKVVD